MSIKILSSTAPDVVKQEYFRDAIPTPSKVKKDTSISIAQLVTGIETAEVKGAFTTRQTANGEKIVSPSPVKVQKIAGATVKCYSLVDFSSAKSVDGVTVTANNNTLTISGTPTSSTNLFSADITSLLSDGKTYNTYQSVTFSSTSGAVSILVATKNIETGAETFNHASATGGYTFVCDKSTYTYVVQIQLRSRDAINTTVSFMLYEGTDEKPYQPYFKGLKNAYFEKVVSTGRSLIDFSTAKKSVGGLTVTADNNTLTISGTPTYNYVVLYREDITDLLEDGGSYSLCQSEKQGRACHQLVRTNIRTGKKRYDNSITTGYFTFVVDKSTYTYTIEIVTNTVENSGTFDNFECSFMFYKGTTILPYEPYTESELGFSSSPDLAIVEEVADDNLIYLSDMSNISVGMLIDFYYEDGTIISGATSRKVLSVDIEEKSIVIDGADPMENVPVFTTVRRSAQVKLPEWDYILPQAQKIVRQTRRVEFTGTESFTVNGYDEDLNACYIKYNLTGAQHSTGTADGTRGWGVATHHVAPPTNLIFSSWRNATEDSFKVQNGGIYLIFVGKTVEEAIAYLAEQYAAGDPVIVEYKLAEATEEGITIPNNYTAYQGGLEKVVQGNTDNSEYGAIVNTKIEYVTKLTLPIIVTQSDYESYDKECGQMIVANKISKACKVYGKDDD